MIEGLVKGCIGRAKLRICGACPEALLQKLSNEDILFWGYEKQDELTAFLWVSNRDIDRVTWHGKRAMVEIEVMAVYGVGPFLRRMGLRVVLIPVLLLVVCLTLYLQTHIWFFQVTGNETVPEEEILWALEECGVTFGTGKFDLNQVKNQVLSLVPELRWLTINLHGGTAQVVVREKEEMPVIGDEAGPRNIVASKGGMIMEVSVQQGDPQVEAGQLVEPGQLLISGVTDLEKTMLLSRAEGEVYARTWSEKTAVLPKNGYKKVYTGEKKVRLSLEIGKKTINFFKTSGISYGEYDKMTVRKRLTLPGGYTLPVAVTVVTLSEYTPQVYESAEPWELLSAALLGNVKNRLVAGSILDHDLQGRGEEDCIILSGTVECLEEIGRAEEISD